MSNGKTMSGAITAFNAIAIIVTLSGSKNITTSAAAGMATL
jgi:hypothetical protein